MQKKITPVVAIDIGNVCINLDFASCSRIVGVKDFWAKINNEQFYFEQSYLVEIGKQSFAEYCDHMSKFFNIDKHLFFKSWMAMMGSEVLGMREQVGLMKDMGLKPVFFSNLSWAHWKHVKRNLSFMNNMSGAVLSCEAHSSKPESRIYEVFEQRYCDGNIPCLYFDDKVENIEAGIARGWPSFLVKSIDDVQKRLEEFKNNRT